MRGFFARMEEMFQGSPTGRKLTASSRRRDPLLEEKVRSALNGLDPALGSQVTAGWNSRMRTTAGVAVLRSNQIWLNPALREVSEEEVERTLLHELAHLLARHRHPHRRIDPHGVEWRAACLDLGIPGESRTHRLPFHARRLKRRFILRCPVCGRQHERVRSPKRPLACLHCCRTHHGGHYNEKYRFVVSRIGEEPAGHGISPK
jgi:SprT protein